MRYCVIMRMAVRLWMMIMIRMMMNHQARIHTTLCTLLIIIIISTHYSPMLSSSGSSSFESIMTVEDV